MDRALVPPLFGLELLSPPVQTVLGSFLVAALIRFLNGRPQTELYTSPRSRHYMHPWTPQLSPLVPRNLIGSRILNPLLPFLASLSETSFSCPIRLLGFL